MTKKEMLIEAIKTLGYKPQTDEDGDVFVRFQMKTIYFMTSNDDEPYVGALLPQFAEFEEGQEPLIFAVCNKVTRDVKLAKAYIDENQTTVSAACEFFFSDQESLNLSVEHSLIILGMIRSTFQKMLVAIKADRSES